MTSLATRVAIAIAATSTVCFALVGCTASPTVVPHTTSAAAAAPGLPAGVKAVESLPTNIPNDTAARATVQLSTCSKTTDGWKAAGDIANPGKASVTRTITVFFTTSTATVIQTAQTKVTVEPGQKVSWSTNPTFTAPAGTLCVLRGVG